jgi:hypothetical protein
VAALVHRRWRVDADAVWSWRRRVGRAAAQRKGGRATLTKAGTKLTDEITHRAVGDAEAPGDLRHRLLVEDDGTDDFVVALLRGLRIAKELLPTWVVHDRTSELSSNYW